ncbi:MAG: tetratricopeptide repeat protein [Firmicutes bacterium]|nr:tetratricopeptide repeat protein [Bacillota bacterium]
MKNTSTFKRFLSLCLVALLALFTLSACDESGAEAGEAVSWQDYYNQGAELFAEGNYDEAIAAFSEAIGLDPEQVLAYIGRGDSYVHKITISSVELEENLAKARADYEEALARDGGSAEAYLGMADVLIRTEEFQEAWNLLEDAQRKSVTSDQIQEKIKEFEGGKYVDSSAQLRRKDSFDANTGELIAYTVYEYDFLGRKSGWRNYGDPDISDGYQLTLQESCAVTFDDNGRPIRNDYYNADGSDKEYQTMEYDDRGLEVKRCTYTDGALRRIFLTYYDDNGKETGYDVCDANGTLLNRWKYDFDDTGNVIQENCYGPDGTLLVVNKPSGD